MFVIRMCVTVALIALLGGAALSQENKLNSADVIRDGSELLNKNRYKEALALYKKVDRNDTNYVHILYNLSYTSYLDSSYEASLEYCQTGLKLFPERSDEWNNLIANNLDNQGKSAEAILLYDKIISSHSNYFLGWFNKGVTYYKNRQLTEAKKCFQQCLLINPYYAAAHYQLGNMAFEEGNMVAAMLCYTTNLVVNPENKYSGASINKLSAIAKVTDEVVNAAARYKPGSTDDFEMVQEIILSKIALDPGYKLKASLEDQVVRQLQVVLEKIEFNKDDNGFWMQYYIPFYEQVLRLNQFEPFIFYVFRSVNIQEIKNYNKKNASKEDEFINLASGYFSEIRTTQMLKQADRAAVTSRVYYRDGVAWGKGKIVEEGKNALLVDAWDFYYDNGAIKSKGVFNQKQEKTGDWIFYYENGQVKEKSFFKDNAAEGKSLVWFDNGALYSEANYKAGELNGDYKEYYYNGQLNKQEYYVNGQKEGTATKYSYFGTIDNTGAYKNDKEEGDFTFYYKNRQVSSASRYAAGNPVGDFKQYHLDGTLKLEGNILDGKRNGTWKEYYTNGKLKSTYTYIAGNLEGDYREFYENGNPSVSSLYKNNKLEDKYAGYDFDGKVFSESLYEQGRLRELKFFDKTGNVISTSSSRSGGGNLVFFDPQGNKTSDGFFTKDGLRHGKSTFYYRNGKIRSIANYKDGLLNGEKTDYFLNGKMSEKLNYLDGEQDGYQVTYFENGNKNHEGEVIRGNNEGLHLYYTLLGQLYAKTNYRNGQLDGYSVYYYPNGKPDYEQRYVSGWLTEIRQFDTTGKVFNEIDLARGKGAFAFKNFSGFGYNQVTYANHYMNGLQRLLFTDNTVNLEQHYKNGIRDSVARKYYYGGKPEYEGNYKMDEKDGRWSYYHENGKLNYTETYNNGSLNGTLILYNDDGSLDREMSYYNNELNGDYKVFGDNQLGVVLNYWQGRLLSYSYPGKTNQLVNAIPVKNGTANIVAYYANGNKSVEIDFENDQIHGKRIFYYPNGKVNVEVNRISGNDHGLKKYFYPTGQVKKEENYYYGNLHGPLKNYWENGNIKLEENWYNGERHGITKNYDATGKLLNTLTYYYGILQSIK